MSASEHPEIPDTAMATGNDEGEPGEQRDSGPLDAEERRLLEALARPGDGAASPAVEDSPQVAAAIADDAPLPAADGGTGGDEGDALTPEFTDR